MNRNNKKVTIYFILFSLMLVLGVVYAILQANLQINGTAKIAENRWNVHFDNIVVNPDSVSIGTGDSAATIDPTNPLKLDFSITLSLPGDFYEFTVDVKNEGSIDAMIGTIEKKLKVNNVETETVPEYLNYTVTYDGGDEILGNHLLEKNTFVTYKVRIEFKTDINAEDLPDTTTLSMTVEPTYVQADDTAIKKLPFYACTYNGELVQGAEYVNGQYTYTYWPNQDGWGVILTDKNSTDPVTTRLCTSINEKPIVSMHGMFSSSKTTSIDTSSFNTSNVTNMTMMFSNCTNLTSIDVSSFDTSNVTNMTAMFNGSTNLESLDLDSFDTSKVTTMNSMFSNCISLSEIDVSHFNTPVLNNITGMFSGCSNLESLDLSNFDVSHITSFGGIFSGSSKLMNLNLDNFVFTSQPNGILAGLTSLKSLSTKNWIIPESFPGFFRNMSGGSSIEEIDVTGWDLSHTINFTGLFDNGSGLKRIIGLETWDTSNITSMRQMFNRCSSLTNIDLSSFDTSKVIDMTAMFYNCSNLKTIEVGSGFITDRVTDSTSMFYGNNSLIGGNGTTFDSNYVDKTYARIDAPGTPGYFTRK